MSYDVGARIGDAPYAVRRRAGRLGNALSCRLMKPFTHSLLDVFGMDVSYSVPLYQRSYVWKKDTHWEPLWEDVLLVLESSAEGEAHSHFLGAIVLEQQKTAPGDPPRWLVIDGQQRLTTLQLLLAAAAPITSAAEDCVGRYGLRDCFDVSFVTARTSQTETIASRNLLTNTDRDAFRLLLMSDGGPPSNACVGRPEQRDPGRLMRTSRPPFKNGSEIRLTTALTRMRCSTNCELP